MRLFTRRARCCECGRLGMLMQWRANPPAWVCVGCALQFGYDTVMPSIQEMIHARSAQR